jgi:hypothetical protein
VSAKVLISSDRLSDCRVGMGRRDRNGHTYESLGLRPDQITLLHFEPVCRDVAA